MNVVYIKHFENGKKYVGITNDFRRRMSQHESAVSRKQHLPLYKAMKEYSHYTEIVFESTLYSDVGYMEIIIIQNFKDLGVELYNLTNGGGGSLGFTLSEEGKKKISEANKGEKSSNANPIEYYEKNSSRRDKFKRTCDRMSWSYLNFEEILSDETYVSPSGRVSKQYFYVYRGEEYVRKVDWSTAKNKPKEYYEATAVLRGDFKDKCEREGWDIGDFEEVFSGGYYYFPNTENRKIGKYFYKYIGGGV